MTWEKFIELSDKKQKEQKETEENKAKRAKQAKKQRDLKARSKEQRESAKIEGTKQETEAAIVDRIAIKATRVVLKRIVDRSADDRIRVLRGLLEQDLASVDNLTKRYEVESMHGRLNKAETISDALDLLQVARAETVKYLLQGKTERSLVYVIKRKYWDASRVEHPYTELKTVTVFEAVMRAVNKEIYRFKGLTACNASKTITTENGDKKTVETVSQRIFYDAFGEDTGSSRDRVYRNVAASAWQEMNYGEAESLQETVKRLKLTDRELLVLTLRMRGYSIQEIAKRVTVCEKTIYNLFDRLQERARQTMPQKVKRYGKIA